MGRWERRGIILGEEAGGVLWIKVCPLLPSFLGLGHQCFLEPTMVLEAHVVLCETKPGFFRINEPKTGFFELLKNLGIKFFWIWSIIKVYIICCILAQNPYLAKIWFLRYGAKCSWPVRLQNFQINYISRKKWWQEPGFLHVDTDSWKLIVDIKILGWAWSKKCVATLFTWL